MFCTRSRSLLSLGAVAATLALAAPRGAAADEVEWEAPPTFSDEAIELSYMDVGRDRAGHVAIGATELGLGLGSVVAATEYGIATNESFNLTSGFLGASGATLIGVGAPTLLATLISERKARKYPEEVRAAVVRYRVGKSLAPLYTALGATVGTIGLVVGVEVAGEGDPSPGPWILGGVGYGVAVSGGLLALRGDKAMGLARVWEPRAYIGVAVPLFVVGGVALGLTPAVRGIQAGTATAPQALIALGSAGGVMLGAGAAVLGAGINQHTGTELSTRERLRRPQILGASPIMDTRNGVYGMGVLGTF